MAEKLLIILLNTNPDNPAEAGTPFFQATVAASMEYEVEIVFTGAAGQLAQQGVAEKIALRNTDSGTLYDVIKQAHEAGVSLKVCAPAKAMWGDNLIPEVQETVGGGYIISAAMSDNTVTFTY
ncbi:MAG: peroxiredoxin [Gammaproteobacteria bacterium]|nr:peroxiredoxin [Gammaproteobacteria bacterium]